MLSIGINKNDNVIEGVLFYEDQNIQWVISTANKYFKKWSKNGKLVYYSTIKEDTQFGFINEGPVNAWYDNGILDFTGQFTGGKPSGKWIYYDETGRQIK